MLGEQSSRCREQAAAQAEFPEQWPVHERRWAAQPDQAKLMSSLRCILQPAAQRFLMPAQLAMQVESPEQALEHERN